MDGTSGHYVDLTQSSCKNDKRLIVSDGADVKMNTEVDSNALVIQTLSSQNGLFMITAASTSRQEEEVDLSPNMLMSLPVFTGEDVPYDASRWLGIISGTAMLCRWSDAVKLKVALAKLKGPAHQWQIGRNFKLWVDFDKLFKITFVDKVNVLNARVQSKTESFMDYYYDKIKLCKDLELGIDETKLLLLDGMGIFSNSLFQYLSCRSHHNEDELLFDIMNFIFALGDHNKRFGCKPHLPGIGDGHSLVNNASNQENNNSSLGSSIRQQSVCPEQNQETNGTNEGRQQQELNHDELLREIALLQPAYHVRLRVKLSNKSIIVNALVDSGSPISLIQADCVGKCDTQPFKNNICIAGINGSRLNIKSVLTVDISLLDHGINKKQMFYAVKNSTMSIDCLLGRDFISGLVISFGVNGKIMLKEHECSCSDIFLQELALIEYDQVKEIELKIGEVSLQNKCQIKTIYREYLEAQKPKCPEVNYEVNINLKDETPFKYQSQILSYSEKNAVKDIIFDLLIKGIIKESKSKFCSSIVLKKKKNNCYHMYPNFKELNLRVNEEHYPLPHFNELLNNLNGKKYFTKLGLKNSYFNIRVAKKSTMYLSFSTFFGFYEYLKLPFGYCNSSSEFMRFLNIVFKELITHGQLLIYLDELLIATESEEENLKILKLVLTICNKNLLELREDKCCFLQSKITYLGYLIDSKGVRPNPANLKTDVFQSIK